MAMEIIATGENQIYEGPMTSTSALLNMLAMIEHTKSFPGLAAIFNWDQVWRLAAEARQEVIDLPPSRRQNTKR